MPATSDGHLSRLRRLCLALPDTMEKLSHGEPTFFVRNRVFAMFANNHHHDGHVAVWLPAEPGVQEVLVSTHPRTFYRPPYVGGKGWIGVELAEVDDGELLELIRTAHHLIAPAARTARKPARKRPKRP